MIRGRGEIKLHGPAAADSDVPADVLVHVLHGLQRLVLLVAADREGQGIRQRFKPSSELRRRYQLLCSAPQRGSYVLPLLEEDQVAQEPIASSPSALAVVVDVARAVSGGDVEGTQRLIPDRTLRERVLKDLGNLAPKRTDRWKFELAAGLNGDRRSVAFDYGFRELCEQIIASAASQTDVGHFIGELQRVDYKSFTFSLRHPSTGVSIRCVYIAIFSDEIEESLHEGRKDLIQVYGVVEKDAAGTVLSVTDVFHVEPVDLTPLIIEEFPWEGRVYKIQPGLVFAPVLDDDEQQVFAFEDAELGLSLVAESRDDLLLALFETIPFLWSQYVESSDRLSVGAQRLRDSLLRRVAVDQEGESGAEA